MTSSTVCRQFSLAEIHSATEDFIDAHVIGKGGFGKVYKGQIDNGSVVVAIKRLAAYSNQGETEFEAEMKTLTKFRHRNLVSLIGYCSEREEMVLVYDYMPNGTLADHLHKESRHCNRGSSLSWNQRLKICIGAGGGLDYLHSGCSIIHRDVKPTNILLDENFTAKVSDFGLAKHLSTDILESHVIASVKGSFGHFDPSYFTTGRLTKASDTYAFGVVLLEVLSGRPAVEPRLAEDELCMSMWAQERIRNGKPDHIVASNLKGEISEDCLKTFVGVVKRCLHYEPKKRLTLTRAVAQLELALEQQERKGMTTHKLQIWPFWSRVVPSGSKQKDANEVEVDKLPRAITAIQEEDALENKLQRWPFWKRVFPSGSKQKDSNEVETIPASEEEDAFEKRALQVDLNVFRKKPTSRLDYTVDMLPMYIPAIPLAEIKENTDDFNSKCLIANGSGRELTFHGVLKSGQDVAIKSFYKKLSDDELSQIFKVSRLKHGNVVQLLGSCADDGLLVLVYEFAPRGSLHDILHGLNLEPGLALSWSRRIKIAVGVATGICYIHDNALFHRDIRSNNVVLFDDEIAKITHPQLSNRCSCGEPSDWDDEPSFCLSPEKHLSKCAWTNQTPEGDVYSFGMVLLELLTGSKLFECTLELQQDRVSWAKLKLNSYNVHNIVDARFKADYPRKAVETMAAVAKLCLYDDAPSRPSMTSVLQALQIAAQETRYYHLKPQYSHT